MKNKFYVRGTRRPARFRTLTLRFTALLGGCVLATNPGLAQTKPTAQAKAPTPPANRQAALTANNAKIDALLKQMTLEEKVHMLHANSAFAAGDIERLGIPELMTSDGPHGVRPEQGRNWKPPVGANDAGTYLPNNNTLASTWNPGLGYAYGTVLGSEANARGKDVILGPGINIMRAPLNGRNFEYFSEDAHGREGAAVAQHGATLSTSAKTRFWCRRWWWATSAGCRTGACRPA